MTKASLENTYEVIDPGTDSVEAFGIRYKGLSSVQAAKINKIYKQHVMNVEQVLSQNDDDNVHPFFRFGKKLSPEASDAICLSHKADAQYAIEKVAAKAPKLVRELIVPQMSLGDTAPVILNHKSANAAILSGLSGKIEISDAEHRSKRDALEYAVKRAQRELVAFDRGDWGSGGSPEDIQAAQNRALRGLEL